MKDSPKSKAQTTVIVGLSGGVDSAVAAAALLEQGYRVTGLFMKNWEEDDDTPYCTAIADLADAQQVADTLGIELLTANFAAEYWDNVFDEFLSEYRRGRTPNPDVLCNREIKFNQFVNYARTLGADYIATGHYARLDDQGYLCKGRDQGKDQSYFLQAVPLASLQRCLFPLGEKLKSEVRTAAAAAGFANHAKKDSTGICFIGERRFADFLAQYLPATPGPIVDAEGATLGQHPGLHFFTLGQRQGLGLGGSARHAQAPWFVYAKEPQHNRLYVTQDPKDLMSDWLSMRDINWLLPEHQSAPLSTMGRLFADLKLSAKTRYRQSDQACTMHRRADGEYLLRFAQPQRATTPGQYACLYSDERCLGGGIIESVGRRV